MHWLFQHMYFGIFFRHINKPFSSNFAFSFVMREMKGESVSSGFHLNRNSRKLDGLVTSEVEDTFQFMISKRFVTKRFYNELT